nr:cysteine-rich secretory protein 1-like [Peromyscus maniculatus bairdii]
MDMMLFPLLLLAAVLPPSLLQVFVKDMNFEDLITSKESVQEEIVNKHNQLRRMVSPPGSDLLKMQWSNDARVNAQKWANRCYYTPSLQGDRTTVVYGHMLVGLEAVSKSSTSHQVPPGVHRFFDAFILIPSSLASAKPSASSSSCKLSKVTKKKLL